MKKIVALLLTLVLVISMLAGCGGYKVRTDLPKDEVVLTVAGSWTDCRALDKAAAAFSELYPNCTIVYEYLQDYYVSLEKRMTGEDSVDLFFTTNIQADSPLLPYALDLNSRAELDLSETFDGLIENFTFRESSGENTKLYAVPLGAEMRGLYVNTTLLTSLGLSVPTDQASLLAACETLKANGYIPFHGNPGNFSQMLVYPWIASSIANAEDPAAAYERVSACEAGLSGMFEEPYRFLYTLVENGYYDYKTAQTDLKLFLSIDDPSCARDFFNIVEKGETLVKADDVGKVAFFPSPISIKSIFDKTKEDYYSEIEYVFIPAPVGVDGGYAYLSPTHGIGVNKNSSNLDWSVEFLNFLFKAENNEVFSEAFNVIPNTEKAFEYIKTLYDIPENHICHLGQVTFNYGFYDMLQESLVDISKANNPKYMKDDGNGNLSLYPFEYYMEELEAAIAAQ